jgi:hypothetical protein
MNRCVFTICAKNYLARALTLRESIIENNIGIDFYIYLSDICDDELAKSIHDLIVLDKNIVPDWEKMAFKYDVIEFSTSIKPFCINHLFNEKEYEEVMYLDPDICVYSSLNVIFFWLDEYDMVITPHYNNLAIEYNGTETEEELLFVGIYNLGFCAIKKSEIGINIVSWWMNRLKTKCYADKNDSLHVDQRWIDFLPAFFPGNILITHHPGMNVAIWNLHERELIIKDGQYLIKDKITNVIKNLLFFHFAGFNPDNKNKKVIHKSFPCYNTDVFPSFEPLIEMYREKLIKHNHDFYSQLKYDFNYFTNSKKILPINRRLFRSNLENNNYISPFNSESKLYYLFKNNHLISKYNDNSDDVEPIKKGKKKKILEKIIHKGFRMLLLILGIDNYQGLLNTLNRIIRLENQYFILRNDEKE